MNMPSAIKAGFGWYKDISVVVQLIDMIGVVTEPGALSVDIFGV